ncbi:hypothetical protein [Marinomonas colpomeniae]|uniref:Lysozyme inhibitor LprI N-terminal domain-containing protein n=1 Tax=Marinomonas colpomeniae TaxID=2774408 RepID=A0ABR8NXD3_9GAMM|nr:hypothetical protein [Marinomonas colpomeniae]MBD5770712.1 hypothetical protein [Marinomonas colpomeniae]
MKLKILKLSIFLTMFNFLALSATTCAGQEKADPTLSTTLKTDLKVLQSVTSYLEKSSDETEIRICIEKTRELEELQKKRNAMEKTVAKYERAVENHKGNINGANDIIKYFQEDCDEYNESCDTIEDQQIRRFNEINMKMEAEEDLMEYREENFHLMRKERALKRTFDANCERKTYLRTQVVQICKDYYSREFPICRYNI